MSDLERRYVAGDGWQTVEAAGGASISGVARIIGPFAFNFDDANLAGGIEFYTPTVDDILLDVWCELTQTWDGTTPLGDIGFTWDGGSEGLFALLNTAMDMSKEDSQFSAGFFGAGIDYFWGLNGPFETSNLQATNNGRVTPGRFGSTTPLKFWVSQDGLCGGDPPGGAAGSCRLYLWVATPSPT